MIWKWSLQYNIKPDSKKVLRRKDEKNFERKVKGEHEIYKNEREGNRIYYQD